MGQVAGVVTPAAPGPNILNGPVQGDGGVTLAAPGPIVINGQVPMMVQLDAADERRNLINEEAIIQSEVWRLGYAEYSEYIVRSEYIVQAQVSERQANLNEMEAMICLLNTSEAPDEKRGLELRSGRTVTE